MKRSHQLLGAVTAGTIAMVALFAYLIWSGYREKMEEAATTTRNYAAIIEARFDATLRRAGAHVQVLAAELPSEALNKQAVPRFDGTLNTGLDMRRMNFPELVGLRIFDTAGDLIYTSESSTTPRVNAADRDYFRAARDNPLADLVFSEVALSRITGRPALFMAKAVRDSKGEFRGLVSASVDLEYFQKLFQSLDIGEQGLIAIFRSDTFMPVLRRPALASGKSMPVPPGLPTREAVAAGKKQGTFEIVSPVDGVNRIFSINALKGFPFFVGVGISTRDVLAGWLSRSLAVSLAALLLLGLLLAMLYRLWHTGAARDRLAAIVENSNYAILGRDLDGVIVSWNAGAEKMLGYSAAEAIGRDASFCLPRERPSRVRQNTDRLLKGEMFEHETDRVTKDGRIINVFTSHSPIRDDAGKIVGSSVILQDITALKQAERSIHDSEERFRATVDQVAIGIAYFDLDDRYIKVNRRYSEITGYAPEELQGTSRRLLSHPDDLGMGSAERAQLLAGALDHFAHEKRYIRKDGAIVWVRRTESLARDNAGAPSYTIRVIEDITQRKITEAALRNSEVRFRDIAEAAGGYFWETDVHCRYTFASERCEIIFGRPPEELLGHTPAEFMPPGEHDRVEAWIAQNRSAEGTVRFLEHRSIHKSGNIFWQQVHIVPLKDTHGAVIGYRGTGIDVTARKQTENSLQLTQFSIDRAVDPVFWIKPDAEIIYVNDAACRVLGYAREEMVGKTVSDIDPHFPPQAWPAHWEELKTKKSLAFESNHYTKNGSLIHTEVTANYIQFQGHEYNCAFMRDITERKLAGATRALLATIVENATDAIISRTLDGIILSWNAAAEKLFGYTAAEAIGQPIKFIMPGAAEHIVHDHSALLAAGKTVPVEEVMRVTKDGTVVPVIRSISPIRNESQSVIGAAIVMHDISALKHAEKSRAELEAQLRESQKMQAIGTLAGGVAHDFNNIIATILGNTDLARKDTAQDSPAQESLVQIDKAAARARDLVQQILTFSRRQPTHLQLGALGPIVEETARLLRATLPARLALNIHCEPDVPVVLADATQIQQVLINLATNASQAIPEGSGCISIRLDTILLDLDFAKSTPALLDLFRRCPGPTARLAVSDTGLGMNEATLSRVFEPFFTTKPVGEGTGLGLSVAHGIVQEHQGVITAVSEPGAGSTFTLYLPSATEQADTVPRTADMSTIPQHEAASSSARVIYIDDDEDLAYLVKRLLERRGYHVASYTHAPDALAALRANPGGFDLMLTDYNMPGMSGLDVATEVRNIRADLPVAVASGFIDEKLQDQAAAAGVKTLIFKADSVEMFCDTVQQLVNRNSSRNTLVQPQ